MCVAMIEKPMAEETQQVTRSRRIPESPVKHRQRVTETGYKPSWLAKYRKPLASEDGNKQHAEHSDSDNT